MRHRLNRDGDRRLDKALHMAVIVRMTHDPETKTYVERRVARDARNARSDASSSATSPRPQLCLELALNGHRHLVPEHPGLFRLTSRPPRVAETWPGGFAATVQV